MPGPMDTLLLKDYAPASSLVVARTPVAKARYPVIDAHTHSWMSEMKTPADVDAWVRRSVEENAGGELEFQYHLDYGQPEANCLQINRTLGALGTPSARVAIY